MKRNIVAIVAMDENGAIGKGDNLLTYIPGDLKRFKEITSENIVIMGNTTRKTLPQGYLPNRVNIVLTRDVNLKVEPKHPNTEIHICHSVEEVMNLLVKDEIIRNLDGEERVIFCIGGGEVYRLFRPWTKYLMVTKIHKMFEDADVFFAELDKSEWEEIARKDFKNRKDCDFDFSYINYEFKRKVVRKFLLKGEYNYFMCRGGVGKIEGVMTLYDDDTFSGMMSDTMSGKANYEVSGMYRSEGGISEIAFFKLPQSVRYSNIVYHLQKASDGLEGVYEGDWGAADTRFNSPELIGEEIFFLNPSSFRVSDFTKLEVFPIRGGGIRR